MKSILIIGNTGTGKTTFVKSLLKKTRADVYIYDINNEYTEFNNLFEFSNISDFTTIASQQKDSFLIFEEATIFFSNKSSGTTTTEILVRKRHTNNFIVFVFHSLRTVPLHIFDLCDILVLHKTGDNINLIQRKFDGNDKVINAFNESLTSEDKYFRKIVLLR